MIGGLFLAAAIAVKPQDALIDEPVSIVISGVPPASRVTISLRGYGDAPRWSSSATFTADSSGEVDVARSAPVRGDYGGVDAMGLFWSVRREGPPAEAERRVKATLPEPEQWTVSASVDGTIVASTAIVRRAVASDITMTAIHEHGIVGVFYQPAGTGRHPTVLVLSGSGGGLAPPASAPGGLASRGYAVLSLAYFGVENLPERLHDIPLEYFETALQWLVAQPSVDPARLAVVGTSRGGELALLLASLFPQLRAVVAYVPSSMVVGGCCTGRSESSWTVGGRALAWAFPNGQTLAAERAAIRVEKIHGAVLLISGKSDRVWPSSEMARAIMARLDRNHFGYAHEHLTYDDAGHGIGRPYSSTMEISRFGGTPAGTAKAREDSWHRVLSFLETNLR